MDSKPEKENLETMMELIMESLMELSNSGITVVDVNEHIIFLNDRFLEMWGFERENLVGKPRQTTADKVLAKLVLPDVFSETLHKAYSDPGYHGSDFVELKDGSLFEWKTNSLSDKKGRY